VDKTFLISQALDKNIEMGDYKTAVGTRKKLVRAESILAKEEKEIFSDKKLKLTNIEVDEALEDFGIEKEEKVVIDTIGNLSVLSKQVKKKIIGQDSAVDLVVKSLIRARLGLRSKKRPLGNFLFLGPTGVGKTELAKVLSDCAYPHKGDALIRLDMSDFSEKHTVARLVGAPPGYVGYGEGGELTTKIDLQPESVVLFDEIEKAHPDVLNILLQIMDEGELKDAKGNTFDFSKSIIVLTSNLGTEFIHAKGIGFDEKIIDDANLEDRLKANLKRILKPELINRFDELIVFKRLSQEEQLRILDLLITEIIDTLTRQKVSLKMENSVKKLLLKAGYSQEYGARALRRTVEKELLDKVAEVLLEVRKRPLCLQAKARGGHVIISTCRK
jgi:ATP-dependent Clp protease ATP-binding subunit ClpA